MIRVNMLGTYIIESDGPASAANAHVTSLELISDYAIWKTGESPKDGESGHGVWKATLDYDPTAVRAARESMAKNRAESK